MATVDLNRSPFYRQTFHAVLGKLARPWTSICTYSLAIIHISWNEQKKYKSLIFSANPPHDQMLNKVWKKFSKLAEYDEPCCHGRPQDPDLSDLIDFDVLAIHKFRGHFSSEARRHRIPTFVSYFRLIPYAPWPRRESGGPRHAPHQDHQG